MPDPDKGAGSVQGELSPEDRAAFERRLSELDKKLGHAESQRRQAAPVDGDLDRKGMAYGMRMASEFVAAIVVGGLIGYALDTWVFAGRTAPWLFLVFFFLGFAAGVMNVMRGYRQMQGAVTARTGGDVGKPLKDDDD